MRKKTYTIYDIQGNDLSNYRMLVHIEDEEFPGDWQFYNSLVIGVKEGEMYCDYHVKEWLTSMWQSQSGKVYACSMSGRLHALIYNNWKVIDLDEKYSLNHIWGFSDNSIYCCGLDDVLFQKTTHEWNRIKTHFETDLLVIGGTSANNLYILGEDGKIFFYDGMNWSEIESPTNHCFVSIFCASQDEIYISGWEGTLFKGSRLGWQRIDKVDFDLWSIAKFKDKILVAGGEEGLLAIDNNMLVPFNDKIEVMGVQIIEDCVFAFMDSTVHKFDGATWTRADYDFTTLIAD